jgi:RNA polymerase sigma-70 factor (ECF subfamily)
MDSATAVLVGRLREHDPRAAKLLETHYRRVLIRFCWGYLGGESEAEDAVQEVFLKVVRTDPIPERFRPWLYQLARNQCLNMLRARARRVERGGLPEASQIHAALTGQLTGLVREEVHARLTQAVRQLSDDLREALRLRYVENLSRVEIAEILDLPESVVKSRLFEGIQKLRACVPPND